MKRVPLKLDRGRSYDTVVGRGILSSVPRLVAPLGARRGFLVHDRRLFRAARALERSLERAGWTVASASVVATEPAKDYRKLFGLYTRLIESGTDRHSVVFALGGGVIGDLTGFLAGTYLRGVRWVGLPTTLLAQVDSSVGGKTGVNHPLGKNLIGVFHQPSLVVCDTAFLSTLSERDRVSGLGEMLKYGLIFDAAYFRWLVKNRHELCAPKSKLMQDAVARAVRFKARVVERDELERTGLRRTLNFGHTLGHAIESATGYRRFRHGEAIILGMRLAAALSLVRGRLSPEAFDEVNDSLSLFEVPRLPRGLSLETILEYVKRDKKAREGKVSFVLLRGIGRTVADDGVSDAEIMAAFRLLEMAG